MNSRDTLPMVALSIIEPLSCKNFSNPVKRVDLKFLSYKIYYLQLKSIMFTKGGRGDWPLIAVFQYTKPSVKTYKIITC
jgi:hypothetical protein